MLRCLLRKDWSQFFKTATFLPSTEMRHTLRTSCKKGPQVLKWPLTVVRIDDDKEGKEWEVRNLEMLNDTWRRGQSQKKRPQDEWISRRDFEKRLKRLKWLDLHSFPRSLSLHSLSLMSSLWLLTVTQTEQSQLLLLSRNVKQWTLKRRSSRAERQVDVGQDVNWQDCQESLYRESKDGSVKEDVSRRFVLDIR